MSASSRNLLLSPRLWLCAGVLSFGLGIGIGYHQDQMAAQNALAQKVALPASVAIQEFSSGHKNLLNEVHLLTEAAVDRAVRIDVGGKKSPRLVDIVPLFPVSRQSLPIAASYLKTGERRPIARALAPQLVEERKILARVETVPAGLMVLDASPDQDVFDFKHLYLGQGANGPLVDLIGVQLDASEILKHAADPLAKNGIRLLRGTLVVSPYLRDRFSGAKTTDFSTLRRTLFGLSALMIFFSLASLFSILPSLVGKKKPVVSQEVKAVGVFPSINPFQPIANQDELAQKENEHSPTRCVSRVLSAAVNTFRVKSRP